MIWLSIFNEYKSILTVKDEVIYMNLLTGIVYISVVCFLFYKAFHKSGTMSEENDEDYEAEQEVSYDSVGVSIDNLNQFKNRLDMIEDMITDIEICAPDQCEKSITIKWSDEKGICQNYDFWISGDDLNTELILKMAYSERNKLRSLLAKEIMIFSERSNENCYDNYENLSRGEG